MTSCGCLPVATNKKERKILRNALILNASMFVNGLTARLLFLLGIVLLMRWVLVRG